MHTNPTEDRQMFLSTLTATRGEQRLAVWVVALSLLVFVALAPFAKTPLAPVAGFIPGYQSALVVIDLITVTLLFNQFYSFGSRALLVLAAGYLFTAFMTVAHTLTFPGLFAPTGLLGAGPQSTAWLYMFWHGGFPLFVIVYTRVRDGEIPAAQSAQSPWAALLWMSAGILALVVALTLLVTADQSLLPAIMDGNHYTASMITVVSSVWLLSLIALALLWRHEPRSLLDLWLMVVMCAWLIDVALSAVLNHGRYDLGFYAGRIYGLLAASFVLVVLLAESGMLHRKLVHLAAALQRLTTQDGLTGINNRRAFDAALDAEWRRAVRGGLPLSLVMIDVDRFKAYNDGYGHQDGDACLQAVAATLATTVSRATDFVARYGGEEFVVLLPQTGAKAAGRVAERLRAAVAALAIPHRDSPQGHVTISLGVACAHPAPGDGQQPTALVRIADQSLYAAKAAGRDQVVVAPDAVAEPRVEPAVTPEPLPAGVSHL